MSSVGDGENRLQRLRAEFVADALFQHLSRIAIPNTIFDNVVENPRYHGVVAASVARKDYRYIRRMGQVGKLCSLSHLPIVMFGRERERMVDDVRITGGCHCFTVANQDTICSSPP